MGSVTQPLYQVLNICYVADMLIYIREDDGMILSRIQGLRKIANWAEKGQLHLYGNVMQFVDWDLMFKALLHLQHMFSSVLAGMIFSCSPQSKNLSCHFSNSKFLAALFGLL